MSRCLLRSVFVPTLAAACVAACSGSSPGPTAPSPPPAGSSGASYLGSVSVPGGRTGLLIVNSSTNATALARAGVLAGLRELLEPRLLAQGGTASGALTLDDGTVVSLSGTQRGNQIELSGSGGYNLTASVSAGSLSGTLVTPQGTATVTPLRTSTPYVPPAGSPTGVYEGAYTMTVTGYFLNVILSNGQVERNCIFEVVVTGTLRIEIMQTDSANPDYRHMHWSDDWRETSRVVPPCAGDLGPFNGFSSVVTTPRGPLGVDMPRDPANIQFTAVDQSSFNGGSGIRTFAFVGALSGTTIAGLFIRSSRFSSLPNPNNEHSEGYPPTEILVTLQKR